MGLSYSMEYNGGDLTPPGTACASGAAETEVIDFLSMLFRILNCGTTGLRIGGVDTRVTSEDLRLGEAGRLPVAGFEGSTEGPDWLAVREKNDINPPFFSVVETTCRAAAVDSNSFG